MFECSTSTAPSLPPAGRLGSLSSADLCAVAAPQPRPTLDIARLDPTTSLHSNGGGGGGGNGHGSNGGGGNGHGSNGGSVHGAHALGRNGHGNGSGNSDTARSGPAGAAGGSGLWGAGPGGTSGGAGDGGCRLPPVSEAAVLAAGAAQSMPAQQAQLQSGDGDPAQQPCTDGAVTPPVAGGKTPQGGRADRQQHSGSGGSSNSPDEGHERRATGAATVPISLVHMYWQSV
jgi:hypothetical protein